MQICYQDALDETEADIVNWLGKSINFYYLLRLYAVVGLETIMSLYFHDWMMMSTTSIETTSAHLPCCVIYAPNCMIIALLSFVLYVYVPRSSSY